VVAAVIGKHSSPNTVVEDDIGPIAIITDTSAQLTRQWWGLHAVDGASMAYYREAAMISISSSEVHIMFSTSAYPTNNLIGRKTPSCLPFPSASTKPDRGLNGSLKASLYVIIQNRKKIRNFAVKGHRIPRQNRKKVFSI
jgi:hypothetical protein